MNKKWMAAALALVLALSLVGCGSEAEPVPVVQVSMLTRAGAAADSYGGVVISENAVQVQRDMNQTVADLYVSEGDHVREGQKLFSYDSDTLNLTLDRQELDLDRLKQVIKDKKAQITDVKKELKTAKDDAKTQLNIQLRSLEAELKEAEYEQEDLEQEIKYTKQMLRNVDVKSPIDGTIRKIDTESAAYITIQQKGAYQVRGQINELNVNAGIMAGTAVTVVSRLNPEQTWSGTVTMVDYNNASANQYDALYGNTDAYSSSTSYPFYIALDSTEGLLLGQHVYIRLAGVNEDSQGRVLVPESYLGEITYDEETMILSAFVWCPNDQGKLEKRTLVLGEYQQENGCYVILEGLAMEDFVADPTNPDCKEGAVTDLRPDASLIPETTEIAADATGETGGTAGTEPEEPEE